MKTKAAIGYAAGKPLEKAAAPAHAAQIAARLSPG